MDECLKEHRPRLALALALAQGDTTTVLVSALASFYHKIPFGHSRIVKFGSDLL